MCILFHFIFFFIQTGTRYKYIVGIERVEKVSGDKKKRNIFFVSSVVCVCVYICVCTLFVSMYSGERTDNAVKLSHRIVW